MMIRLKNKRKRMVIGSILLVVLIICTFKGGNKVYGANITYTVSYSANKGTGAPAAQVKLKDKTLLLSKNVPKRTGYIFKGWAVSSTAQKASYKPGSAYRSNKSIRLYAVWEAETYKITYHMNGGTGVIPNQTKVYNKSLKLSDREPKRTGYIFRGWSENKNAPVETYKSKGAFTKNKNTVLYAVWKIKQYRVTYHAVGAKNIPISQIKTYGRKLRLSTKEPVLAAAEFRGWAVAADRTKVAYLPGQAYTANKSIDLYAVWKWKTYKVTYHANGGSAGPDSQLKSHGKVMKITKTVPRRSGYTFLGWGLSSNATTVKYFPGDNYEINAKEDLYAMWGKTKRKSWNFTDKVYQIGSSSGVFTAHFTYTEDYMKKGTQTHFYKHATCLEMDYTMLTDEEDIIIYPPVAIVHKNSKGKEIGSFVVNKKEDTLAQKDYMFSYSNRKKVTYSSNEKVIGSSGFFLTYGADVWNPPQSMEMDITGNILKTVRMDSRPDSDSEKNYYYSLGEIEKEYMDYEQKRNILTRSIYPKVEIASGDYMIYDVDIRCFVEEKQLQREVTREDIIKIVEKMIVNKELVKEAVSAGYERDILEARDYIKKLREELKKINNYEEHLMFIAGTQMEEEDYWKKKEEEYRRQLTKKAYIDRLYEEYIKDEPISISKKYEGIKNGIKQKLGDEKIFTKQEFIIALKQSIIEDNNIIINEKEVEHYLKNIGENQ